MDWWIYYRENAFVNSFLGIHLKECLLLLVLVDDCDIFCFSHKISCDNIDHTEKASNTNIGKKKPRASFFLSRMAPVATFILSIVLRPLYLLQSQSDR